MLTESRQLLSRDSHSDSDLLSSVIPLICTGAEQSQNGSDSAFTETAAMQRFLLWTAGGDRGAEVLTASTRSPTVRAQLPSLAAGLPGATEATNTPLSSPTPQSEERRETVGSQRYILPLRSLHCSLGPTAKLQGRGPVA